MSQTTTSQPIEKETSGLARLLQSRIAPIIVVILPIVLALFLIGGSNSLGIWLGATAIGLSLALVGVGVYITFRILDFPDLTIDGTYPLGAAFAAVMIINGYSPWLTLPAAFVMGGVFGAITAVIATKFKIHSLLASIIVATGLISINLRLMGRSNIPLLNEATIFSPFADGFRNFVVARFGEEAARHANNLLTILVVGLIVILCKLVFDWFTQTELGMAMRATGDNRKMIKALGRNPDTFLILGVAISNAMVGLAGAIVAQFQGFADVNMGLGLIIAGLAAVIVGETIVRPTNVQRATLSAIIGMIIYRIAIAAALSLRFTLPGGQIFRIEATDVKLATALLVLIVLWLTNFRKKRGAG
ncbi:MAG: ABC transporter permease [Anaerolineaceae bacterium]|nr:ABC transporter permease [Anaerolineaceae bacterium]